MDGEIKSFHGPIERRTARHRVKTFRFGIKPNNCYKIKSKIPARKRYNLHSGEKKKEVLFQLAKLFLQFSKSIIIYDDIDLNLKLVRIANAFFYSSLI